MTDEAPDPQPLSEEHFQALLSGERQAETAEELMRARYLAYANSHIDFIIETHDPKTKEQVDRDGALAWSKESDWKGLQVVRTEEGGKDDTEGVVEFIATYEVKGVEYNHHEIALFRKSNDKWFFVDGTMVKPKPVRRTEPKVGRNDPCPCGSKQKYKKCHGAPGADAS